MPKKVDELAGSKGSTANTVMKDRQRMESYKNIGNDVAHTEDGLGDSTHTVIKNKPQPIAYAPREGNKKKSYGRPFGKQETNF